MENNNLNELEQLKAQYETLKQQFDQQEIVNKRLMKSAIKTSADYFTRYRRNVLIAYPITAILCIFFLTCTSMGRAWSIGFALLTGGHIWSLELLFVLFYAVAIAVELRITRNVRRQAMENSDLLMISKNMQKLKTEYAVYLVCLSFFILFLISMMLVTEGDKTYNIAEINIRQYYDAIWRFGFAAVLLAVFIIMVYRNFVGHCNDVIRQIDAAEGKQSPRWNRTFSIFLCVIAVVLSACVYMFYAALHPKSYVRADNDNTTEGKLAIWEVYADTTVNLSDASTVMDYWQHNDSLVVMKEYWIDNQHVRLYAMKKTTPAGPALCSALIGGKPVIQRVDREPYKNATPMSVYMTPEASKLWFDLTKKAEQTGPFRCALSVDGVVYQDWKVVLGIPSGSFFVFKKWSKEELEDFCNRLINN